MSYELYLNNRILVGFALGWSYYSKDMDENGLIANSGKIDNELLNLLMEEKFILKQPPKSTGRDMFGKELLKEHLQSKA